MIDRQRKITETEPATEPQARRNLAWRLEKIEADLDELIDRSAANAGGEAHALLQKVQQEISAVRHQLPGNMHERENQPVVRLRQNLQSQENLILNLLEKQKKLFELVQSIKDGPTVKDNLLSPIEEEQRQLIVLSRQTLQALRNSEESYQALFNSIDEGFCIIEMLFDQDNQPVDYRFLETNPAFEEQTGLQDAAGKRMRELGPSLEEHWFQTYGRIALTGEPQRFINQAKYLNDRWYDVYAFRIGDPAKHKVAVLFNDISARVRADEALEKAYDDLRMLNSELERRVAERTAELAETQNRFMDAVEAERTKLAREIHDGIMQDLFALQYRISALAADLPDRDDHREARAIQGELVSINQNLRAISKGLLPPALSNLGLEKVIRGNVANLSRSYPDIKIHLELECQDRPGDDQVRLALFRIYQIGITNVLRHSRADQVTVRFYHEEGRCCLEIEDNGVGFEPPENWVRFARQGHMGLLSARERAEAIGGTLEVQSEPGVGTRVQVLVPVP